MAMGSVSRSSQAPGAPGGTRSANQALIVVFERDESLAGLVLGQLRAQGYEGRSARTPVEVFDLIARSPVRLALVNLGQAATSRREFWIALDAQRLGRGVQVITYRYLVPGSEPDQSDGSGRADVEVRGPLGFSALMEVVRSKLPPPLPPLPDSSFLVGSNLSHGLAANGQSAAGMQPGAPAGSFTGNPSEYAMRQQPIAGVLNLSGGMPSGQPPEFAPLPGGAGASMMNPANGGWTPEINRMSSMPGVPPMNGSMEQRGQQWMNGHVEAPPKAAEFGAQGWPGAAPRPEMPGNSHMRMPAMESLARNVSFQPSMPMGDLAAMSDAINALAAAGVPGYQNAAAAVNAMNASNTATNETTRWPGQSHPGQNEAARWGGQSHPVQEERKPANSMNEMNQSHQGGQSSARNAAETLYMGQQAFAELSRAREAPPQQDTRSRALGDNQDEYEYARRARAATIQTRSNEQTATPSRRLSGDMEPGSGGEQSTSYQNQMLAPIVAPGQIERSLSNVLVEGQLVSQQRLEVAQGIQRLLRGVDIDYRLGEVLLLFKFLTRDQLLAALLVSRGLVSPAQVASMGRIKQELHAIGMEYDLENLLILFRLLSSEQLREIRSDVP